MRHATIAIAYFPATQLQLQWQMTLHWWHHCNCTLTHLLPLFNYNDNEIWLCADVYLIYGTLSCWIRTTSEYVGIGVCLNLNVSLLGVPYTMIPSQLHIFLLLYYNGNDVPLCADADVDSINIFCIWNVVVLPLDEQKVRWYALVYVWIDVGLNSNVSLVYCMIHHDSIEIALLTAVQLQWQWHTALRWCALTCCSNTQQWWWNTTLR